MVSVRPKLLHMAAGASGGLAGIIPLLRCPGASCSSCYGCIGVGLGLGIAALFRAVATTTRKSKNKIEEN